MEEPDEEPIAGVALELTTRSTCLSFLVDPSSVSVWGFAMDYLDTIPCFSYKVVYAFAAENNQHIEKTLRTAQQTVCFTLQMSLFTPFNAEKHDDFVQKTKQRINILDYSTTSVILYVYDM